MYSFLTLFNATKIHKTLTVIKKKNLKIFDSFKYKKWFKIFSYLLKLKFKKSLKVSHLVGTKLVT